MVKKAGSYLMNVVLPKFVQDLCALEVSPMDGQTLTDALHSHGINIRYLGKVMDCFMIWNFMPICHSYSLMLSIILILLRRLLK